MSAPDEVTSGGPGEPLADGAAPVRPIAHARADLADLTERGPAAVPGGPGEVVGEGAHRLVSAATDLRPKPDGTDVALRAAEALGMVAIVWTLLLLGSLLFARFGLDGVLLSETLLVLLPALLWAHASGRPLRETFRLERPAAAAVAAALLLAPALCVLATALLAVQLEQMPFSEPERAFWTNAQTLVARSPVRAFLAFAVAPAVAEEALFRGVLLRALERRAGTVRAIAGSAVLFALLHASAYRILPQLALGLVLGALVVRSGSLAPAVVLHFGYNLGILVGGQADGTLPQLTRLVVVSVLAGLVGLVLLARTRPRRASAPVVALCLLVLAASGCARGLPAEGQGSMTLAIDAAPLHLDPRLGIDTSSQGLHQLLFASLLEIGPRGELEKDLAVSVETDGECTWTVKLRPDAVFSDGRPLVAEDVRATFDGLLPPRSSSPRAHAFAQVESVEATDDETVVFRTREPFPSLPVNLTVGIVPAGSPADVGEHPIGAGPFRARSVDGLTALELEPNPFHHHGVPGLSALVIRVVPDATTRCLELRNGSVDLVLNAVPPDALGPLARDPDLRIETAPGTRYSYVGINFKDPLLARREVREAIAYAIDRDALIASLYGGYARKAAGPIAPGNPDFVADLPRFEHDPAAAMALLDRAGLRDPDGPGPEMRFRLVLRTSTDETSRLQALAMADMLAHVGIGIEVRSYEFATFFEDVRAGRFQLFTLRLVGLTDPDWFRSAFHSRSTPPLGLNRGRYASPELDTLLERAAQEMDPDRRRSLYVEVQKRIAEDVVYVSLYHLDNVAVASTRLRGLRLYASGDFTPLAYVSLDRLAR